MNPQRCDLLRCAKQITPNTFASEIQSHLREWLKPVSEQGGMVPEIVRLNMLDRS